MNSPVSRSARVLALLALVQACDGNDGGPADSATGGGAGDTTGGGAGERSSGGRASGGAGGSITGGAAGTSSGGTGGDVIGGAGGDVAGGAGGGVTGGVAGSSSGGAGGGAPGSAGSGGASAGSPSVGGSAGAAAAGGHSPGTGGSDGGAGGDASGCSPACTVDQFCANGVCVRGGTHASLPQLAGPFASGPEVTARCIECHADAASHVLASAHWRWKGPTPGLEGHTTGEEIGKDNLINNFCIAVRTNEARCTQCHSGYGYRDTTFDFSNPNNIDCLGCHAAPGSGYAKDPKMAGAPVATADLAVAARSVGATTTQSCGSCHFAAGGGDNVKNGALGSALGRATPEIDAHLGGGMTCATCHQPTQHQFPGTSVFTAVAEGRVYCEDCHGEAPHQSATLDNHAMDVACQTCHIPAFSRTQPTKVDWDWSTAGNRTVGTDGIAQTTLDDGTVVTSYDAMKGNFVWQKSVTPSYAWYDGGMTHLTTAATDTYGAEGASAADPVTIAAPTAGYSATTAKIHPFKVMTGRQPGHVTGRFLIVPKLFGPGGFWGAIPAAASYTPEAVASLWERSLTAGAIGAGQIAADQTIATGDYEWVYTEMYLNIDHEVAPSTQALGCADCHGGSRMDWQALGYGCDPMAADCTTSRNPL